MGRPKHFGFDQRDIPDLRVRMCVELLDQKGKKYAHGTVRDTAVQACKRAQTPRNLWYGFLQEFVRKRACGALPAAMVVYTHAGSRQAGKNTGSSTEH